jgi:hypothetical protein
METLPKLERIRQLTLTPGIKLVCMSDMHRGDGSGADDFAQNSLIYRCALEHYLENGFTYVELGDAEELWENDNFDQIYITHTSVYELLTKFHALIPRRPATSKSGGTTTCTARTTRLFIEHCSPASRFTRGSSWRRGCGRVAVRRSERMSLTMAAAERWRPG